MGTLSACRTITLYNPPPREFAPSSAERVEQAIVEALKARKWVAVRESPGSIGATLNTRGHMAVVRIEYTASSYQIEYVNSVNLRYARKDDGSERIHRNYNAWIIKLVRDIDARLPSVVITPGRGE